MEYCIGATLIVGNVNLSYFTSESVERDDIQSLVDRSEHVRSGALAGDGFVDGGWPAQVEVTLANGETITKEIQQPTGTAAVQVSSERLWTKFRNCVEKGGRKGDETRKLYDSLSEVEKI